MIPIAKAALGVVTADINPATLETLAFFFAAGLLVTSVLVLYGPDVSAFELYGNVP